MSLVQAADATFDLGPDAFGYTLKDSYTEGGPVFNWIEIAPPAGGHGIELSELTYVDDGWYWPLGLPFTLPFYGSDYDQMAVSSNGVLYFEDDSMPIYGGPIPDPYSNIGTFIAHFWNDLVVAPGAIYVEVEISLLVDGADPALTPGESATKLYVITNDPKQPVQILDRLL